MSIFNQKLKFGDLPLETKFYLPYTKFVCKKTGIVDGYNIDTERYVTITLDTVVELVDNIDFYSIALYNKFVYDNKIHVKIGRNRAKEDNTEMVTYFEPDVSVSPL